MFWFGVLTTVGETPTLVTGIISATVRHPGSGQWGEEGARGPDASPSEFGVTLCLSDPGEDQDGTNNENINMKSQRATARPRGTRAPRSFFTPSRQTLWARSSRARHHRLNYCTVRVETRSATVLTHAHACQRARALVSIGQEDITEH